jgi:hypothetical protein
VVLLVVAVVVGTRGSAPQRVRTVSTPSASTASTATTGTTTPTPASTPASTRPPVPTIGTTVATMLGTGDTSGLEALPDGAWVGLWGLGQVIRVDAAGTVTNRLTIGKTVDSGPLGMAQGAGSIWVMAFTDHDQLLRIDPETGHVTGRLTIPGEAENVAVGDGAVWVTACCATSAPGGFGRQRLYRIDPHTLVIERSVAVPGVGEGEQVVVGADGVYVEGQETTTIARIDPEGTRIEAQPQVGDQCMLVAQPIVGCFVNDINDTSSGQLVQVTAGDRTTTSTTPGFVSASTIFHGHLVIATPLDLYELDGAHWRRLGRHPGVTQLSASGDDLWAVQGNQVQRLLLP